MGDFNIERSDPSLKEFLSSNNLHNLIKSNTCFKGKCSCIDLFLTNKEFSFKFSASCETGISDHHHMIYTVLKTLQYRAKVITLQRLQEFCDCGKSYEDFYHIFTWKLNKHAPKKKKMD